MTVLERMQTSVKTKSGRWLAILTLAGAGVVGASSIGQAETGGSLEGAWKGSGWVSIVGGNRERAQCQVHYSAANGAQYSLTATCATDSGKASQTARIHKAGEHAYKGQFYNAEYDVTGQIRVIVRGNKQTVTLTSDNGTALITLSR
jgi:hypothetical protein